jgi:hypothetical protein
MASLGKDGKRACERTVVRKDASGSVDMTVLRRGGNGSEITISLRRGGSGAADIELDGRKANQPTDARPRRSANSRQSSVKSMRENGSPRHTLHARGTVAYSLLGTVAFVVKAHRTLALSQF